jgi:hypothetical protein
MTLDILNVHAPEWMDDANCADIGATPFFPTFHGRQTDAAAMKLCAECPVATACLAYALEHEAGVNVRFRFGIYGGTPAQRVKLSKGVAA